MKIDLFNFERIRVEPAAASDPQKKEAIIMDDMKLKYQHYNQYQKTKTTANEVVNYAVYENQPGHEDSG